MSTDDYERAEAGLMRLLVGEANRVRLPGADWDDALQEARIGLWKALRDFEPRFGVPFERFAALCIRRQVVTSLKVATRGKARPLSDSVRVVLDEDGEPSPIVDALTAPEHVDPAETLMRRESLEAIGRIVRGGSRLEREVMALFAAAVDQGEITATTGYGQKTIDNALQRTRRKVRAYLAAEAA